MYHGDGKLVDANGLTYEGEFLDGNPRHTLCVFAFAVGKFTKSILSRTQTGVISKRSDECFDFTDARTLVVGDMMISFKGGDNVQVHHYNGIMETGSVSKEAKQTLRKQLKLYALCLIDSRYVLLTGGADSRNISKKSALCFVYDIV